MNPTQLSPDELLDLDVETLTYEQCRDGLIAVVGHMESGGANLEQTVALWERGELFAAKCAEYLDGAEARLSAATADGDGAASPA